MEKMNMKEINMGEIKRKENCVKKKGVSIEYGLLR